MQKFLRTLMLAALMIVPFASQAQTLTVCNGTVSNEYVPFQGWNADAAQHNQLIYPATDLTAMSGLAITQMVFYIDQSASNGTNTAASRLGTWTVSLGETTATTLSALDNTTTLTQVYQGYFDCSTGTLTLEFDQAYMYNGGNLLVDLNHAAASYNRWYFLGVDATDAAYTYGAVRNFLPKCTFTYGAAPTCFKVTNLAVSAATSNSLTLTWTDALNTGATYSIYSVTATDTTLVQANITGTTHTVTGLNPNTMYTYAVKTDCGAGDVTDITTPVSGRTACAATTSLPFAENFSGYTGLPSNPYSGPAVTPACWDYYSNGTNTAATTSSAYYGTVATYTSTSSYACLVANDPYLYMPIQLTGSAVTSSTYIGYGTARGSIKYAVLPAFDAALNTLQISFDYKMSTAYSATGAASTLDLGYITNDDTNTFVSIWNHNATTTLQHVTELNLSTLAAAAPAGARLTFKFHGTHNGTGTSSYSNVACGIDNILVEALPSCTRVSDLTATAITNNSVTLTWNDIMNTGATYTVSDANGVIATGISAMTYTVTGLTANTDYTFSVVANCSATDNSAATSVSAHTDCDAMTTLPYLQTFEAEATGTSTSDAFAGCWNRLNNGTQYFGHPYIGGSTYNHTDGGAKGLYWTNSTTTGTYGDYQCIVLPELGGTYSINGCRVKFWAKTSSTSYHPVFIVGVMTNAHDINSFVAVDTVNVEGTTWTEYTANLNGYTGNGTFVAIRANRPASSWYAYVDDILLEELPSCIEVTDLAISGITATDITLSWADALNSGATYTVYNMADTSVVASGIAGTTYTVTGLTAQTNYTFGVVANCSATETSGVVSVSAMTPCASETMPWSESFDTWESKSPCWSFLTGAYNMGAGTPTTTTSGWAIQTSTYGSYINLTGKALGFNLYSTNRYWAVTPNINITSDAAMLNVDVAVSAWSASTPNYDSNDTLAFAISTNSGSTWTNLLVLDGTALNALSNTYTTISVPVLNHNGETVRFAIFGGSSASGGDNRIIIDNVSVGEAPSCIAVTGLTAVNVTADSATLTWNSTGSSSYTVIDMSDSSYVASVTDTFYVLTGLTAMTSYTYGVAAECSSDNSDTILVSFATACGIVTLPYTEGFEANSGTRNCWTTDGPGSWSFAAGDYSTSTGAFEGSVNAKITHSSEGNVTKLISPVLDLDGATGVQLTYAHIQRAWAGDIDELRVYYRTSATDTWTVVAAYTNEVATWTVDQVMLPATTYQVAFEMTDGYGYGVAVDSVVFTPISANYCLPVTGLTAVNVTADSATLTWNSTGSSSYTIIDMSDSSYVASVTDTFYVLTGLTAMTSYTYGVAAECSSDNSDTILVSFATACTAVTLPYSESFSTTSATSSCWELVSNNTANEANMGFTTVSGRSVLQFSSYTSASDYNQYGFSPLMNVSPNAVNLQVNVTYATYDEDDELYFGYITATDTIWDPTAHTTTGDTDWQTQSFTIPATAIQLAVHYYGSYAYYAWIDSLSVVELTPSYCYPVTNVTVDSALATSVTISWSDTATTGNFSVYNGTTYVGTTTDTFYTFTGLTAATNYTFGVRALCSASDSSDMATVAARTDCANGSCQITFTTGNYGFLGASVDVMQGGVILATVTDVTQAPYTQSVNVCGGIPVSLVYHSSPYGYDAYVSFTVSDGASTVVYTCTSGSTLTDGAVFTTIANACPSCFPVTDLTVDAATTTSVTISWSGNAANYKVYNGAAYVASTTDTFYTFTGLTAATAYTFGVQAFCSATDSATVRTINTRTDCVGGSCQITINGTDSYGDGWDDGYGTAFSMIAIMQSGDTIGTFTVASGSSYSETFQVCSGAPVTFSWTSNSDYDDEAAFQILDGGNTVVYTCTDASTLTDGTVFTTVADPCPSCAVTALTVDTATTTSVTISWTGSAASYDVYNGTTFVATVTTNNYTFTGLTAATAYTFGVQAICSATDSSALATINAMTACADITSLPYLEGFENGLGCWTSVNGSADGVDWNAQPAFSSGSITPHTGNYMAASWSWNSSAMHADAWLISPKFVLPTVNAGDSLTFSWWARTNHSYPDSYSVVLSNTTNDTAAFTNVIRPYAMADTNDTWVLHTVDLSAYAGQSVYIAFHHVDYDNNYLLIDDIALSQGGYVPPAPDTMTVTFAVNDATMGTTNPAPGTYQYLSGDTVRFEAIATTGHVFTGWQVTVGSQSFTAANLSVYFEVNSFLRYGNVVNVTANFEPGTPDSTTITYAVNDPTLGTTNPAPGTYTIYVGDSITASATAYTGSVLAAWAYDIMLNGAVYSSDTLYSDDPEFTNPIYIGRLPQNFVDAGASIVITAIFEDEDPGTTYYTITGVANDPDMGYVLGSNRYAAGSEVVLTAVANNGYRFVRWSNGETTATITFTATENVELTAFFEVDNTGIEDANMANVSIYSTDNKIVVRGAEGQSIYVFDLNGRVMASENNAAESVEFRMQTTGVYLVKVGTAAAKRVVLMR